MFVAIVAVSIVTVAGFYLWISTHSPSCSMNPEPDDSRQPLNTISFVCESCQATLFSQAAFRKAWNNLDDDGYRYTVTPRSVHNAATRECHWCQLLVPVLSRAEEYTPRVESDIDADDVEFNVKVAFRGSQKGHSSGSSAGRNTLVVEVELPDNGSHVQKYEIHAEQGMPYSRHLNTLSLTILAVGDVASEYIAAREIAWQVAHPRCYVQALEMLRACTNSSTGHENCRPALKGALPTRVLDCLDPLDPRLHVPTPGTCEFYVALSYVWGEDQPYKTTTSNLSSYLASIDRAALPQTILDAIACTRALGLRFLWIDALCILQDSDDDKFRELAQMRHIYRNAYVTTIAATAPRVSTGFLQDRSPPPPSVPLPFVCPSDESIGRVGTMFVREPRVENMSSDPINSRAWCLQERLLPQRSLIYSSTLQYACVSQHPVNINGANDATFRETVRLEPFVFHLTDSATQGLALSLDEQIALRNSWNEVVAEYTRRDLSDPNDKLVALGGVAEEFSRFWKGSDYLAGLWRHNLLEDLLWTQLSDSTSLQKRYGEEDKDLDKSIHRAPTWSWASVRGSVGLAERMNLLWPAKCQYLCEVVNCRTTLQSTINPFGAVTEGVLELKALLRELLWNPTTSTLHIVGSGGRKDLISRHASRDCDEEASRAEGVVWGVPVRRCEGGEFSSIEGILVVPGITQPGSYRRVGSFTIGTGRTIPNFHAQTWLSGAEVHVSIV